MIMNLKAVKGSSNQNTIDKDNVDFEKLRIN